MEGQSSVGVEAKQLSYLDRQHHVMQSSLNRMKQICENKKQIAEDCLRNFESDGNLLKVVMKPWQKYVNNAWIICVAVRNDYNSKISNVQLLINDGCFGEVETRVTNFTCASYRMCSKNELPPNCSAYIVGIVNIKSLDSLFTLGNSYVSCSILFSVPVVGNNFSEKELIIPPINLKVDDIIKGNLELLNCSDNNLPKDIIVSTAISDIVLLELHLKECVESVNFRSILVNDFDFNEVKLLLENYSYYVMKSSKHLLYGLVVYVDKISENIVCIVTYPRNTNQLTLFKNSLCVLLKENLVKLCEKEEKFSLGNTPLLGAVNAMNEEFRHFTAAMKMAVPCTNTSSKEESCLKFTVDTWKKLMDSNKQFNTDNAFFKMDSLRDSL